MPGRLILFHFAVAAICLLGTCRRKVDSSSIYVGEWISRTYCTDHLEISDQSTGTYYVGGLSKQCSKFSPVTGRFVVNDRSFKIGTMKFKIKQAPVAIDTLTFRINYEEYKTIASMTFVKSVFHGSAEVQVFKIVR